MSTLCKSGLYALIHANGAPLAPADLAALAFDPGPDRASWCAAGRDGAAGSSSDETRSNGTTTIVVGDIWDVDRMIRAFDLPAASSPAQIAAAALNRHRDETPLHLPGEWTLFQRSERGQIIVMQSTGRRDPLVYAQVGFQFACAPDIFALARLAWVDARMDETGLLSAMGRAELRQSRGTRTMLQGVRELPPGGMLILTPAGKLTEMGCPAAPDPDRFAGTFTDAVECVRADLLSAMRQRIARYPETAILLSGGLDSSLLAWLARDCGADFARVACLTSVAPEGSGLTDESHYAALVARHLGLPLIKVAPAEALQAYRPAENVLAGANGPPLSNRHFLTTAFQQAARERGSQRMLNGTYGELTVTRRIPDSIGLRHWPRHWPKHWQALRGWLGSLRRRQAEPPFHVRIAPHRLANLPAAIRAIQDQQSPRPAVQANPDLLGFAPGSAKALGLANEFHAGAIRMEFPFRDPALLHLFAGFPGAIFSEQGDRGVVRELLHGNLPDEIRLRRSGMPASPDHLPRLQRHAAAARQRIAAFRAADVDDWIDLDWLDQALAQMSQRGTTSHHVANEVQLTAIAAEFLLWWQHQC